MQLFKKENGLNYNSYFKFEIKDMLLPSYANFIMSHSNAKWCKSNIY